MKIFICVLGLLLSTLATGAVKPLYTVKFIGDVNETQKSKVIEALEEAHVKLRSSEFKNKVLEFQQPDGTKMFYQTRRTNEEVHHILVTNEWHHEVSFYSSCMSSARAYVQGGPRVYLNWCKIYNDDKATLANTLIHEQSHVFGFTHDYERTELRPYSVPYAVGSIIEGLMGGEKVIKPTYIPWYKKVLSWFR